MCVCVCECVCVYVCVCMYVSVCVYVCVCAWHTQLQGGHSVVCGTHRVSIISCVHGVCGM